MERPRTELPVGDADLNMWASLTQPQATVIGGLLTIIAAIVGATLAWYLLSNKVKDLKTALDRSKADIDEHQGIVVAKLSSITSELSALESQATSTAVTLGNIGGTVEDIEAAQTGEHLPGADQERLDQLRGDWARIRDTLERRAADESIDGRTRAKYARIDRRNYNDLIEALAWDHNLGQSEPHFRSAYDVWRRYRNGRSTPTQPDLDLMGGVAENIAVAYPA